jgi:glycosyltransferase involved in cell wall biosynthesis
MLRRFHERTTRSGLIRVLVVISNLEFGGAQRQVVELVNNADPQACEIHLCSLSDVVPIGAGLRDGSRLHVVPRRSKFDYSVVSRLVELIRRLRIDVVHGFLFDAEIATRIAGRIAGVPVIGSERNTDYELGRVPRIAYRLTRGWVDLVVANSRAGAAFNSRYLGHPPSIYRVVHNGVDTERFRPSAGDKVRAELGIAADVPLIGMVASFKAQKNHPLLLRALHRLVGRYPQLRLLLVGDMLWGGLYGSDVYAKEVQELLDRLGLRPYCLLVGNRQDLPEVYSACDFSVLPSLFEGTPNVVLESMACGCPVIATDVSDNAMVAPDGRVGRIVPSGDEEALAAAIAQMLDDAALRRSYAEAARRWAVEEFSTARMAGKMVAVYQEAAQRRQALLRK